MKNKKNHNDEQKKPDFDSITKRLDALIRITLETHFDKEKKFNLTAAVRSLKSCGLGPKEIADIFGKKMTDISPLLYPKSQKKKKKQTQTEETTEEGETQ
jgi:hypothetical protein